MLTKKSITELVTQKTNFDSVEFRVNEYADNTKEKVAIFSTYSPYGQDFQIEVTYKNLQEIPQGVYYYYHNYDPSYETSLWIDYNGHGKNGAPHDIGDIYEDMKWCEASLKELYDELQEAA